MFIDYSEFLFLKLKNVPLALKNLAFIENNFHYLIDRFRIFRLKNKIKKVNYFR